MQDRIAEQHRLLPSRNAAFTTGAGVNYGSSALTIMNDDLSRIGLEPISGLNLRAGQRLSPAT